MPERVEPEGGVGPGTEPDDADVLLQLLGGRCRAQALSTVAALGIVERLEAGPRTAAELASELECDADTLESLLRMTAALGFLACPRPGRYSLTRLGAQLRADALGPLAAFVGAPEQWDPWARLRDTVRSAGARTPFAATFGAELYPYLARSPEAALRYDRAIDAFTRHEAHLMDTLEERCRFESAERVLDVGGGRGSLLFELLRRWPHLRGTLQDQPHVVERGRARLPADLAGRVEFVGGDFHETIPHGHDRIVLKHVLHNWEEERAEQLLARCVEALSDSNEGRVLVVETVLTPDPRADLAQMMDLEMRVLTGGFARRKPDFRRLFRAAGLRLSSADPMGGSWLLVGERVR